MRDIRYFGLIIACVLAAGCSDDSKVESVLGQKCDSDTCGSGYICHESVCKKLLYEGDGCGFVNTVCEEGFSCIKGVCGKPTETKIKEPGEVGGSCKEDKDCARGKCVESVCTVTVMAGQECGKGQECEEGYTCHDNKIKSDDPSVMVCMKGVGIGQDCRSSLVFCEGGECGRGACVEDKADLSACQDSDSDSIIDKYDRCDVDTDGDTLMDCNDPDSDGDGIPDRYEHQSGYCQEPADSDGDGIYDFMDDDSDNNGMPDSKEGLGVDGSVLDTDGDGIIDSSDDDNDNDGLADEDEIRGLETPVAAYKQMFSTNPPRGADCYNKEHDKWGVFIDEKKVEHFGDGVPDEVGTMDKPFDCDGDTIPDFNDTDSDGDGIPDSVEGSTIDSDNDGFYDRYDMDSDNDGLSDKEEFAFDQSMVNYRTADVDKDGLLDGAEVVCEFATCNGERVSILTDSRNCGKCGLACRAGVQCVEGVCSAKCSTGMTSCSGACYDLLTDHDHCGSCSNACSASQKCVEGKCQCEEGQLLCGNECVSNDVNNCGSCGNKCETDEKCQITDDGSSCEKVIDINPDFVCGGDDEDTQGMTACWGACVDLQSNKLHCGECGHSCGDNQVCQEGACKCDPQLYTECNGVCISNDSLKIDVMNCGECGTKCAVTEMCVDGSCVVTTTIEGKEDFTCACIDHSGDTEEPGEGEAGEGGEGGAEEQEPIFCEERNECWGSCKNLKNDVSNCGACGKACESGQICQDGSCKAEFVVTDPTDQKTVYSRFSSDTDGDGVLDSTEYAAALATGMDARAFICDARMGAISDPDNGITGAFDFYFELPYCGDGCKEDCEGDGCVTGEELDNYKKSDNLNFKPTVSKLDLVFNLDTTNSMGADVDNLKTHIGSLIIPEVRKRVSDSAFGVSRFDDFPTHPTLDSDYDFLKGNGIEDGGYGRVDDCPDGVDKQTDPTKPYRCDKPFQLLGKPETNPDTVQANVNKLSLHHGGDFPESGFESLWQLVMGDDKSKAQVHWYAYGGLKNNKCVYTTFCQTIGGVSKEVYAVDYTAKESSRWGGAKFRDSTLPVVIHITDTTSHDNVDNCPSDDIANYTASAYDKDPELYAKVNKATCKPYDPAYVEHAHYSEETLKAYQEKGARVISIYDSRDGFMWQLSKDANSPQLPQLVNLSQSTMAYVPVCAFKYGEGKEDWKCSPNKCCTISGTKDDPDFVNPVSGKDLGLADEKGQYCVLSYAIVGADALSTSLVDGVDALVKYATSEVAARVIGNPIEGSSKTTACFIKKVEAFVENGALKGYVAPPQEPEASCNPKAEPAAFADAKYNNGYTNFAIGTSSVAKEGAQLNFTVTALNDDCVKPTSEMQVFEAYIELIEPKTGMSFGKRTVSIVVPGVSGSAIN